MGSLLGTAGGPMLNIIKSSGLCNVLVVVTRFFGGILLGTGGLVRAYSEATSLALEKAEIISKELGLEVVGFSNYSDLQKIKYYFEQNGIFLVKQEFDEKVRITFEISKSKFEKLLQSKNELSFQIFDVEVLREKFIVI